MSLQGPIIVVAEKPAAELVDALSAAGGFPIVETNWADAPTAFAAVKPAAIIIAEPDEPPGDFARMLGLQVATVNGPIVPVIARVAGDQDAALAVALPADATLPLERLIARLSSALRVRALHAEVLRRIDLFAVQGGKLPALPAGDALDDATVLIAGRGPLYPALSVAIGERVNLVGAFSVEAAAKHLAARDIDGVVIGDGFSPHRVEAFLTALAQDVRWRDIPVAIIGATPPAFADSLSHIDHVSGDPQRILPRLLPLVRLHAFQARLRRMMVSLDTDGMFDPDTGLLTHDNFRRDLKKAVAEAHDRSLALSLARLSFEGLSRRGGMDAARLMPRLVRNIDFAARAEDGAILVAFTQTDLRSAHVVARRLAAALKNSLLAARRPQDKLAANVTLATLKAGDTPDSLVARVMGSRAVAAE